MAAFLTDRFARGRVIAAAHRPERRPERATPPLICAWRPGADGRLVCGWRVETRRTAAA